jgi:GNAT superfamily N-acetyltransferase
MKNTPKHNETLGPQKSARPLTYLADETCVIAEAKSKVIGFMSVTAEHHISMAFVHPDWHRQGVAGALYDRLLESVKNAPQNRARQPNRTTVFRKKGLGCRRKRRTFDPRRHADPAFDAIGLGRACLGIFMGGLTEGLKQRA